MTDGAMAPEEVQTAREIAQRSLTDAGYRMSWQDADVLAHAVLALTEQQPEPAAPPLGEDPVAVALGLAEPNNADIAARAQAITKRVAILRLERELFEQQPEPVSRDELSALIDDVRDAPYLDAALRLLSRYTITRKPQDDEGRGEHR